MNCLMKALQTGYAEFRNYSRTLTRITQRKANALTRSDHKRGFGHTVVSHNLDLLMMQRATQHIGVLFPGKTDSKFFMVFQRRKCTAIIQPRNVFQLHGNIAGDSLEHAEDLMIRKKRSSLLCFSHRRECLYQSQLTFCSRKSSP